jgi:hypothetical protein
MLTPMPLGGTPAAWDAKLGARHPRPKARSLRRVDAGVCPLRVSGPYSSLRARRNTASSIFSVSLPVDVFCWLG